MWRILRILRMFWSLSMIMQELLERIWLTRLIDQVISLFRVSVIWSWFAPLSIFFFWIFCSLFKFWIFSLHVIRAYCLCLIKNTDSWVWLRFLIRSKTSVYVFADDMVRLRLHCFTVDNCAMRRSMNLALEKVTLVEGLFTGTIQKAREIVDSKTWKNEIKGALALANLSVLRFYNLKRMFMMSR